MYELKPCYCYYFIRRDIYCFLKKILTSYYETKKKLKLKGFKITCFNNLISRAFLWQLPEHQCPYLFEVLSTYLPFQYSRNSVKL